MKEDKRKEVIGWDAYFLGLAALASFRSKDPSTQNGACIVDPETLSPLAMGYNGFPRGCSDDEFPWVRESINKNDTKYPFVEHSERNAIYNAARKGISLEGSTIYIYSEKGYYSCDECTRAIIQSGIKRVVMGFSIHDNTDMYDWTATKKMYAASGINLDVICNSENLINLLDLERANKLVSDFRLISYKMERIWKRMEKENNV